MPSAALRLWIELETRIASQRLHYRSGSEETAAASIYGLFNTVRKLLGESTPGSPFAEITLAMLNDVIRPFTARWHGWMTEVKREKGAESKAESMFRNERVRRMFRQELQELQSRLKPYSAMLQALVDEPGGPKLEDKLGRELVEQLRRDQQQRVRVDLGEPLTPGIGRKVTIAGDVQGRAIFDAEMRVVTGRRPGAKPKEENSPAGEPPANLSGLALSGGGIRSATFCLGIVQVLVRRRLFTQFDYLSTVSGGGYLGAFLSCALGTKQDGYNKSGEARVEHAFKSDRAESESSLLRHMRNHSKYLLSGGWFTKVQIAGLLLSGVLWNLLILLPIPLFAALGTFAGSDWLWGPVNSAGSWIPAWGDGWLGHGAGFIAQALHGVLWGLGFFWITLPLVQLLTHGNPPRSQGVVLRRLWEKLTTLLGVLVVISGMLFFLPVLFRGYAWLREALGKWQPGESGKGLPVDLLTIAGGGAATGILGLIAAKLSAHRVRLRAFAVKLLILAGPLVMLFIFLLVSNRLGLISAAPEWNPRWVLVVAVILLAWGWLFVNINTLAPHRFYRRKLCECYLVRRIPEDAKQEKSQVRKLADEEVQGQTEQQQQVPLTSLCADPAAPYHLINMTLNTPTSGNQNLRGRAGDFFLVSKCYCGSPLTGYAETKGVEETDPHFDLGTAMAVSGAAASSSMGWKTLPHLRFLMALCNIRLGYWLRRPGAKALPRLLEGAGPWYLYREMFGWMNETCRYLNLSDGGHIENLAAYELLRRRCKFIVCVDGGQEPGMQCADLIRLERYVSIDLGITLHYDCADFFLQADGLSRSHAILVKIEYPEDDSLPAGTGWMLYLKLAVTGIEPVYVSDYRRENAAFPHQTTGDQFFDEAQFEAYRALGECAMDDLFRREITGMQDESPASLEAWFRLLAENLLPDNDTAFKCCPAGAVAEAPAKRENPPPAT